MISIKMWKTPLPWHTECSLPVAVRFSKRTCLSSLLLILTSVPKTKIDPTKLRAMAANLQKQYTDVNRILSQLDDSTENKNCERYSCESVKCVTNSTGGPGTDRVKQSYAKTQRNSAKRRKRRKKPSNNILSFLKTSGEKYIKELSNKKMTDAQLKFILRFEIYTGEQSKQKQNPKAIIAGF